MNYRKIIKTLNDIENDIKLKDNSIKIEFNPYNKIYYTKSDYYLPKDYCIFRDTHGGGVVYLYPKGQIDKNPHLTITDNDKIHFTGDPNDQQKKEMFTIFESLGGSTDIRNNYTGGYKRYRYKYKKYKNKYIQRRRLIGGNAPWRRIVMGNNYCIFTNPDFEIYDEETDDGETNIRKIESFVSVKQENLLVIHQITHYNIQEINKTTIPHIIPYDMEVYAYDLNNGIFIHNNIEEEPPQEIEKIIDVLLKSFLDFMGNRVEC